MTNKNIYRNLGNLDPALIAMAAPAEKAIIPKKPPWVRWASLAACLFLIVGAVIVVPMVWGDDTGFTEPRNDWENPSPSQDETYIPIIFNATLSHEKLYGSSLEYIAGSSVALGGGAADNEPPAFEFVESSFVVKARVVENNPDLYYKLDVDSEYKPRAYRLIKMECVETIHGKNIPQYFLYLIPNFLFVDMSVYDTLLISMSRLGRENYVLKNDTKQQMESFELLIFEDYQESPQLGNIIAFSNGIFDESLWQTKSWHYGYQFGKIYLDNPQHGDLVVKRGDSEDDVITEVQSRIEDWKNWRGESYEVPTVSALQFSTQEAKDAWEYVKPFKNGVFSQEQDYYSNHNRLVFRRYINGCQTEETVTIDLVTEEVIYSDVRYTEEDMSSLENISQQLSKKAAEYAQQAPTPPHTDTEGKKLLSLNLYAWYAKVDGKLYGVMKTTWRYQENDDYFIQYYDDAYVLYDMTASTATNISREDLIKIVGNRNISRFEYGIGIEMPM